MMDIYFVKLGNERDIQETGAYSYLFEVVFSGKAITDYFSVWLFVIFSDSIQTLLLTFLSP